MKKSLVRIEVLVYKANASQDKLPFLSQAKDLLVEVKVGKPLPVRGILMCCRHRQ